MADNYLEFSETLNDLKEQEEAWLKNQLEVICVFGDKQYTEKELPDGLDPKNAKWIGCRAYQDMEAYVSFLYETAGFEYEFCGDGDQERYLWVCSREGAEVDRVAHLVQKFLQEFRPDQCWSLTYAWTCSKLRVGEFSGGAIFVTAAEIKWQNADEFVQQQRTAFEQESNG